jgi:hypothetical protein
MQDTDRDLAAPLGPGNLSDGESSQSRPSSDVSLGSSKEPPVITAVRLVTLAAASMTLAMAGKVSGEVALAAIACAAVPGVTSVLVSIVVGRFRR